MIQFLLLLPPLSAPFETPLSAGAPKAQGAQETQEAPVQATAHLRAIPAELTGLVAINDLGDLLAKGKENSWYLFMLDPQLAGLRGWFDDKWNALRQGADASGLPSPSALAAAIRSASAFVLPVSKTPFGIFGIAIQADEGDSVVRQLFEDSRTDMAAESEHSEESWNGIEVSVFDYTQAGKELRGPGTVVCFEHKGVFLFVFGEHEHASRDDVLTTARGCIDRLAEGGHGVLQNPRYLEARGEASTEGQLEVFLDASVMTRFIPENRNHEPIVEALVESISSIPWAHASARLGAGEEIHAEVGFRCDPETLLGQILGLARPAPQERLKLIPKDSVAISIAAFDVGSLVETLIEGAKRFGPVGTGEKIDNGRELVRSQFGVDPVDDILLLFSGEFAFFQRPPQGSANSPQGQMFSMMETIIFGLEDGDALFDKIEEVLTITGGEVWLENEVYEGVDVFSLPASLNIPLSWIITEDFLALSGRSEDIEHLIRASQKPQPSVLDDPRLAAALGEAKSTSAFSVSDTAAVLKMTGGMFDVLATTSNVAAEAADFTELMELLGAQGAMRPSLIDKYFRGLTYSSWTVRDGNVRLETWGH